MLENDRSFGNKRLLGVLNGVLVHSVLSKNSGPGLLGVISGLGVLTEGVLSEFYCTFKKLHHKTLPFVVLIKSIWAEDLQSLSSPATLNDNTAWLGGPSGHLN